MAKEKTIAEIRKALAAQEKRLAGLQVRRGKIAKKLQRVESEIASLSGEPAAAGPGRPKKARKKVAKKKARRVGRKAAKKVLKEAKKAVGRPKKTRGKPLTQYLADALKKTKAGMRAKDLTTAVLKAGYATKDKNFKQTVAKSLGTDKRFKRVSRGVYVLAG